MAKFVPITKDLHAASGWLRPQNYAFAATEAVLPIVGLEVPIAAVNLPLAFIRSDKLMQMVAITAPQPGGNLLVAKDGRWLGAYVPGILRSYPFRLARIEGKEEMALCIAEDAVAAKGEPIYDDSGDLAPMVKNSVAMLEAYEKSRQRTLFAVAALDEAGVLVPWPIKFKSKGGGESTAKGIFRVDEQALNGLDDEAFLKLRKAWALPIAYSQMISMSRLGVLGRLAELRERLAANPAAREPELNLDFLREEDGNIVF